MTRLTILEKVDLILLFGKHDNITEVWRQFAEKHRKCPPKRDTITALLKKFKQTGSVSDAKRRGKVEHEILL